MFCPSWMPEPLDGAIQGEFANGRWVEPDGEYLVSLLWFERGIGGITGEVHVNFRGYPGSVAIPTCEDTLTVKGVTQRKKIPCFADPRGTRTIGGITATRVHGQPGHRPVARPLRVEAQAVALHRQPARDRAERVSQRAAQPRPPRLWARGRGGLQSSS